MSDEGRANHEQWLELRLLKTEHKRVLRRLAAIELQTTVLAGALADAIEIADGLYDQQAMPDDHNLPKLNAARAELAAYIRGRK